MKNYIYNRYSQTIREIHSKISFHRKYSTAKYILDNIQEIRCRALLDMDIKTMPIYLKSQANVIFDELYKFHIFNDIIYPVLWEGRLYLKWVNYPEDLKKYCRETFDTSDLRVPMFLDSFSDGEILEA